jgi:hypothetical protein
MKTVMILATLLLNAAFFGSSPAALAQGENPEGVAGSARGVDRETATGIELEDLIDGFEEPAVSDSTTPPGDDDFLQGFEEDASETKPLSPPDEKEPVSWQVEGEAAFTGIYNISPDAESPWKGVSMLRPELDLTLKNKFSPRWRGQVSVWGFYDAVYAIMGRDNYTEAVLDAYEQEIELRDTYLQGSLSDSLDLKVGRQVVVWGTLDNLRATDVLNPMDLRVPGLTDIEDLRLPVTMLKLDYYFGNWDLSGIVIPEVRFSKKPVFGSDFYPFAVPAPPEDKPDDGFQNVQYAAALKGVFSGMDIGFYGADLYADQAYLVPAGGGAPGQFVRRYPRMQMLGAAGDFAAGNWLFKGEAAWFDGLRYTRTPDTDYTRLDLGGGVEYAGFHETSISLEGVNRHLYDYDAGLEMFPDEVREDEFQWSLRVSRDLLHDTLTLTLLASTFGVKADDGAFERLEAEYDITDAVSIRGGFVFYQSGDKGLFQDVAANDRLFVVLKSSF